MIGAPEASRTVGTPYRSESGYRRICRRDTDGFTLIELLIATTIMLLVSTGVGILLYNAFASARQDTYRVDDIAEAQKISTTLHQLLSEAVCISNPVDSRLVGGGAGWATGPYVDSICNPPPGPADVVAGSGHSNASAMYFFAPESEPINIGTAPPTVTLTEYEAYLDPATHTVNGLTTVHYVDLEDLSSGNVSFIGDDVTGLSFTYYPWDTAAQTPSGCAVDGVANPDSAPSSTVPGSGYVAIQAGAETAAVSMALTMAGGANDTSDTAYNTCAFLPGAAM